MRFLRLDLKAVGPFTDVSLDLSRGNPGLHLIVGPNEAGKSSALRAISHLLFGFPQRDESARFVHDYKKLRVGGALQDSRGEVLEIVRRKRDQKALVTPDEASEVPESRLQEMLGRIDQATFENLLGINHARLREGGKQIREGSGDFAGLLFAAGAGLSGLRSAQSRLQKQLGELYLQQGQNPKINAALRNLKQAEKELQQRILPTDEWRRHDEAFHEASQKRDRLAERINEAKRELARNQRLRDAVPIDARRRRIAADLAELDDSPTLRPDFGEAVRAAITGKDTAGLDVDRSQERLQRLAERLEGLPDPSAWLAESEPIETIQQALGAIEKAARDRVKIEGFRQEDEHVVRGLLRELGRPTDLAEVEALPLRADEPAAIRSLGQQRADLAARGGEARKAIRRHQQRLARLDSEQIAEPPDVAALRRAVQLARKAGDLDASWAESHKKWKAADREQARALAPLAGWSDDAEKLRDLPVPLDATIAEFEKDFRRLEQDRQQLQKDRERIEADHRETEAVLRALELSHDVPTETDLARSRAGRDEQWQAIRQTWIDGGSPGLEDRRTLADGLGQAIADSDALADRLRREAESVARKSDALARLDQLAADRSELDRRADPREQQARRLADRWKSVVAGLGLDGVSPAEVRDWLKLRDRAVLAIDKSGEARRSHEAIDTDRRARIATVRDAIRPHDAAAGESPEPLGDLLDRAETIIRRADQLTQERRDQETKRQNARDELETAETNLQDAEDRLAVLLEKWGGWMDRIGLEPSAAPEQAEVFLGKLEQVRETLQKLRGHRSRLEGIARDEDQFADRVRAMADRLLPDRNELSPAALARELARRLADARVRNQERVTLAEQRQQEADSLETARDRLAAAEARLRRLADEAGGAEPSALLEVARRSTHRAELDRQRAECDDQLLAFAAGRDSNEFRIALETADPDALACRIDRLDEDVRGLQEELERVNQTIGTEKAELARMGGGDEGAIAAEKVQDLLARIGTDTERYATLKLADAILRRGIDRYRSANQGPVLGRASELFRALTEGSFASLQIEDDHGLAIVQGVRPGGQAVGVEGMSEGTHDQLYLALRLAVLESWLESREPVPFVVDDILLTFDDRRAAAALRALADFSRKTQVLMFTHHAHLADLARRVENPDQLSILELAGAGAGALASVPAGG